MSTITYCANGCTRRHGDDWHPVTTEAPSQLCTHCEARLGEWLTKIPDTYALLPQFIELGSAEPDPDQRTAKRLTPPAPMRLDIIDLLDARRGRKWNGLNPADDRRGVAGILKVWLDVLIADRNLTPPPITTITKACDLLNRHRLWLAEQDYIADLYEDIRKLNRDLNNAIGDYRRPPVGTCAVDRDGTPCGGPLYASEYGGVRCTRCRSTWDADKLRLLGLALTQDTA